MKSSKYNLKNMRMQDILNMTNAIFNPSDILNFCDDPDIIEAFIILQKNNFEKIEELLEKNEDKIDKAKMVFNIYLNYQENKKLIDREMESLILRVTNSFNSNSQLVKLLGGKLKIKSVEEFKKILNNKKDALSIALQMPNNGEILEIITQNFEELSKLDRERHIEAQYSKQCKALLKGTNVYIEKTKLPDNHIDMTVFNSRYELEGENKEAKKKTERLITIDKDLGTEGKGLKFLLQSIMLTDLELIMPETDMGIKLREIILINALLKEGKVSFEDIEALKDKDYIEYENLLRSAPRDEYLEELRKEILKNARYIDIDKMILICIYRYEEYIEESPTFNTEDYENYRNMVFYIMSKIKNKNIAFNGSMLNINNDETDIEYTYEDAEKFMIRLTEKEYVSKEQILQNREDLLEGKITVSEINPEVLQLLDLSNEEYEKVINSSDENAISIIELSKIGESEILDVLDDKNNISKNLFVYLVENQKISLESVLELYYNGKIELEYLKIFHYNKEFLDLIDIKNINDEYTELKAKHKPEDEDFKKLNSKIELYKSVYINNKSEIELNEEYNNVMYEIAETFEDENDILFYYENGLISLDIVVEWCGEKVIEKLYNKSKIDKENLIYLSKQGKISNKAVEQILLYNNITYDELMSLIIEGVISESKIVDLYMQGKIFDVDFEEMLNNGIISHDEFFAATELRTQEKLEEISTIKLSPVLKNIPNKKDIILDTKSDKGDEDEDWFKPSAGNKKTLIHPSVRYEYLEKLGAKKAEVLDIEEDNAFYNYEFFVIPDKNGEFNLNSVVIAERFYKDKDVQEEFALDNATYFFQYKDLMVNSNLSKQEMTKERDKIVFRANHRSGSWAVKVLYNIAQTMASSNFKNITNKDQRAHRALDELDKIYSYDELMNILDLAKEIDDDEKYTYDLIDNSCGVKKSNETNNDSDEITI